MKIVLILAFAFVASAFYHNFVFGVFMLIFVVAMAHDHYTRNNGSDM